MELKVDEIAKCGCNCFNCPTYKENIRTFEERVQCSTGWNQYLNIKLKPDKLRACDGCSLQDSHRHIYYLNCKVRKCAIANGFDNCAYCKGFPCEEIQGVHSLQKIENREDFIEKTGKRISEKDYLRIVEPYTGLNHLLKIRQTLKEKDLLHYRKYSTKYRFAPFKKLSKEKKGLKEIYSLLTGLCVAVDVSYARMLTLSGKRQKLLKILWAIGLHGKYDKNDESLEIDGMTFLSQKILSTYKALSECFKDLQVMDIHGKVIPLTNDQWLTPSGGLRKEGWKIRLEFGDSFKGSKSLHRFREYIRKLYDKYGNKGFQFYRKADLSIMNG
jgi:hypothetical protein